MISAERMKSVRIAPLILSFSNATRSTLGSATACDELGVVRVVLVLGVQELVRQLLDALEAEEGAADHQQRRHRPGHERADRQRRRHQDRLVEQRALGHRPHHRQLAVGARRRRPAARSAPGRRRARRRSSWPRPWSGPRRRRAPWRCRRAGRAGWRPRLGFRLRNAGIIGAPDGADHRTASRAV